MPRPSSWSAALWSHPGAGCSRTTPARARSARAGCAPWSACRCCCCRWRSWRSDNGVNTIWYLLVALFWAALWRPRTRAGAVAAAVVAFAAAASTSLALLYAPLFAARAIVVPRRLREHAATAGWALGSVLQVGVIVTSHQSRLRPHDPVNALL